MPPLNLGSSSPTRSWYNHGFLNDVGAHIGALGTRVTTIMIGGRAHVGFFPHDNFLCPDHIFRFVVHFPVECDQICFFLFSCINLRASFQAITQGVGKGNGQAKPMWT